MKYTSIFLISFISCNVSPSKTVNLNTIKNLNQSGNFEKVVNSNNSFALYYKIDQQKNSPVKVFTYYVTDNQSNKIVKTSEEIAAEKIYWKNDSTLAIIPYSDVMKQNNVVGELKKQNEILIYIK